MDCFKLSKKEQKLGVICAANHALGCLTNHGAFDWHMARQETIKQGRDAGQYCQKQGIELGKLAIWYSLQIGGPATFLVGMPSPKIVDINLDSFVNGLTAKEAEVLDYCLKKYVNTIIRFGKYSYSFLLFISVSAPQNHTGKVKKLASLKLKNWPPRNHHNSL